MSIPRKFEIAVIGGGPAGIVAALHAAQGGRKVCLIDRKKIPGYPVRCGEAIGLKGFTQSVSLKPGWIKSAIKYMKLVSPCGISVTVPNSYEGYVVDREKMETDMTADAVAAGAEFFPGTSILSIAQINGGYECKGSAGSFSAQCVILAEGIESRLGRSLGWSTNLSLGDVHSCAFARVAHNDIEPEACVFYLGSSHAPGGYVWVFHRGGNTANVGLGVLGSRCKGGMPRELLLKFINERFPGAAVSDLHCAGVPMGKWKKPLVRNGVMLVGDAARMMNCVSGAGIGYALFSGKAAGTVAAQSFIGGACKYERLKTYQKQWASFYGKQQLRSFSLKEVMVTFKDDFLDDVARSITKDPDGKMDILSIFIKAFSKRPLLLLKVIRLLR
ncbi:MAG TPA: NAD(P)/FAD-dependent oxidoreductase [Chitinivibrionales bacterium]|nr:NAD(P)/FAD-dependent oxidoreductase [Chitinivibrionales bacterium]